jgi:sec-independent protein translocase protein TatA
MGEFSIYHWIVVVLIMILLFGARKIPEVMRGLGQGVHEIRKALSRSDKN